MKIRIYPKSLLETIWQQDKLCLLYTSRQAWRQYIASLKEMINPSAAQE